MRKVERPLVESVGSLIQAVLLAFVVIAALSKVGVQTISLVPIQGATGLSILAFESTLSNFMSGMLNIVFKP